MSTGREIVKKTLRFQFPERLAYDFPEKYGSDFFWAGMEPSPDARPRTGVDEWGASWENIGAMTLGQVKDFPLKNWSEFDRLKIPDIDDPRRWTCLDAVRKHAGDRFLLGHGISIYARVHYIRGLENTWMDIHDAPKELGHLIDVLVDMNLAAIQRYSDLGFDGLIFPDDWGLQNRLMISPTDWRKIWKPRYARIFAAAHAHGLHTFLHSCGYIVDIIDDLVEIGLEAIHMDQQENMGLDQLGKRFGGRITFFAPVDIQKTMAIGSLDEIRLYCQAMVRCLGRPKGGFIPRWYSDPVGAGHRPEAVDAMCEEFLKINQNLASVWH
jgi:uroporphyrinogen decarboxylase